MPASGIGRISEPCVNMIGQLRRWRYRREIDQRRDLHALGSSEDSARGIQLSRLNQQWARTLELSPYFARMRRERELPYGFESLQQFVKHVPPTSRADVQAYGAEM